MKKLLFVLACTPLYQLAYAQTCVGIYSFRLLDQKSKKPMTDKLEKNIWYVFTKDEGEFYDNVETVNPIDSMLQTGAFNVKHNEQGYNFFINPMDKSLLSFSAICGLYLVQTELIRKEDTMRLAIYNIPAHQTFQMDSLVFQKGDFFIDLQASRLLNEFEFVDNKGYFIVPSGMVQPFPKKKEGE
ncbi:MAG: hypothetical protein SH857_15375 [Chitinophagales bacterium]|nr:hypothetical protein [Chitinophagales bacterium]